MMIAVKFADGSEDVIEGLGIPFGGPWAGGNDIMGEHFSAKTDFALDWFPDNARPVLYHHALDKDAGLSPVGRVKGYEVRADLGIWTKVQLDASSEYFSAIKDLVKKGKLFFSSGAMAHLVEVDSKSGEIKRWPWVELSLTPTPANLLATVDFATATRHYKSAGLELPDSLPAPDAEPVIRACTPKRLKELAAEMEMEMSDEEAAAMLEQFPDNTEEDMTKTLATRKRMSKKSVAVKAVSWQDVGDEVRKVLDDRMVVSSPFDQHMVGSTFIEETYSDHVIACVWRDGTERYFSVPFALGPDGHVVTVGQAEEMEETYIPKKPEQPLALMAWVAAKYAASLAERTKDLSQRRIKEGRMISDANRKRLMACMEQMGAAMAEMQTLMDSSAPMPREGTEGPTKAADLRRQAAVLRLYMATLTPTD